MGGANALQAAAMNLQVEVLKTDLPASATFLSCQIEALGSGEVIKDSASLIEGGTTKLPSLKFNFSKPSTHVALTYTASVQSGEEEVGSCLYPLTFNNRMTRLLGQLIPPDLAKKTHLVYLSTKIPGLDIEKMVGKIWFRIRDLKAPRRSYKAQSSTGNWLDMKCMQKPHQPVPPKPNVEELVFHEAQALCVDPVPGETAVVSVLFHSVTMLSPTQVSDDTLTIACMGCLPNIKEDSLFNDDGNNGALQTMPTLKPITLKCGRNDTMLELHVANSYSRKPSFSASCSLANLVPFQHYNWEYNWRWVPGVGGFSPEHSQGNLEANVTVSIVYWPSNSDKLRYEGLEVFVKEVECRSQQEKTDVVLTCQLKNASDSVSGGGTSTPPYRQRQNSAAEEEDCNLSATVIKYSSNDREFSGASGYYFFSSDPNFTSRSGHRIVLTLYATSHNNSLWWHTQAKSTATIDLSEELRRALSWPKNEEGVRWELSGDAISDASGNALTVKKLSGILRWKKTNAEFLGLDTISRLPELPLLSEVSETELGRFFSDSRETSGSEKSGHDAVWKGAVTKMGRDILKLREENDTLKRENREYEKFVVEMESSIIVTAANQKALLPLTRNDLIHKIVELSERLSTEIETRKMFQNKVHKLQNTLIKKNDVEACYVDLQEAHKSQQKLVRELQTKIPKYKKCWETCKQQELVIKQLLAREASVTVNTPTGESSKLVDVTRKPRTADADDKDSGIQKRVSGTEGEKSLKSFREELSIARKRFLELEEKVTYLSEHKRSSTSHLERDKVASLESQLEVAAARERAVMEELRNNATRWAKEKSRYELEIAQMEAHQQQPARTSEVSSRIRNSDPTTSGSVLSSNTVSTSPRQQGSCVTPPATPRASKACVRSVPTPVPTAQHRSSSPAAVSNAGHPLQNSVRSRAISNH